MRSLRITGVVVMVFIGGQIFAQDVDSRLEAYKSKEDLVQLQQDDPQEYNILVRSLDNGQGWYIQEMPVTKMQLTGQIQLRDKTNVNFYEHGIELRESDYQYYQVNGGTEVLVIRSKAHVIELMQRKR